MSERITLHLPHELLYRARRKAAAEGCSLDSLVEEGLRIVITEKSNPQTRQRIAVPVSAATGGPQPGIDITDISALQEMDDLEYIERMKQMK